MRCITSWVSASRIVAFFLVFINPPDPSSRSAQKHQNHRVAAQEHLADEAVLVDRPSLLPSCANGRLSPHLLDVFQHHVAVAVKSLDAGEQLAIVAAGNEDLVVIAHRGLEDGEGPGGEFVLLDLGDFVLGQLVARLGEEVPMACQRLSWMR